jgi:hypothetical protein
LSSLRLRKRILSRASEALEMSSRRKMSLRWYRELMMMSIRRVISAWYSYFSPERASGAEGEGVAVTAEASPPLMLITGVSAALLASSARAVEKTSAAKGNRTEGEQKMRWPWK